MSSITALPPAPNTANPTNFAVLADALLAQLVNMTVPEMNAAIIDITAKWSLVTSAAVVAQAALNAGLANAAANAITASTAASLAQAAWAAALAAYPGINPPAQMNPSTITADLTLPADYSSYSAGPLTIAEGINVTLNDFSEWSIL